MHIFLSDKKKKKAKVRKSLVIPTNFKPVKKITMAMEAENYDEGVQMAI